MRLTAEDFRQKAEDYQRLIPAARRRLELAETNLVRAATELGRLEGGLALARFFEIRASGSIAPPVAQTDDIATVA